MSNDTNNSTIQYCSEYFWNVEAVGKYDQDLQLIWKKTKVLCLFAPEDIALSIMEGTPVVWKEKMSPYLTKVMAHVGHISYIIVFSPQNHTRIVVWTYL